MLQRFIFLFFLFTLVFSKTYSEKYNLSITAIFQNEASFMKEWIDYHQKVGVEHFWLYNNNSTDNYKEILLPYIAKGIVELFEWPSNILETDKEFLHYIYEVQNAAYNDALNRCKNKTEWLAIIDLDEFIVPIKNKTVPECLQEYYSGFSGICINWQMYGTSNIKKIYPNESLLEKLLWKAPTDHHTNLLYKSIVKPKHVKCCNNPHFCEYFPDYYHINANYEKFEINNSGIYVDIIRINHYWTKDEDYFYNVKIPRQIKWNMLAIEEVLRRAEEMNQVYDDCILNLIR